MLISKQIREAHNLPYYSVTSHDRNHQARHTRVSTCVALPDHCQACPCKLLSTYARASDLSSARAIWTGERGGTPPGPRARSDHRPSRSTSKSWAEKSPNLDLWLGLCTDFTPRQKRRKRSSTATLSRWACPHRSARWVLVQRSTANRPLWPCQRRPRMRKVYA